MMVEKEQLELCLSTHVFMEKTVLLRKMVLLKKITTLLAGIVLVMISYVMEV